MNFILCISIGKKDNLIDFKIWGFWLITKTTVLLGFSCATISRIFHRRESLNIKSIKPWWRWAKVEQETQATIH